MYLQSRLELSLKHISILVATVLVVMTRACVVMRRVRGGDLTQCPTKEEQTAFETTRRMRVERRNGKLKEILTEAETTARGGGNQKAKTEGRSMKG